jgi:hypothetical protein
MANKFTKNDEWEKLVQKRVTLSRHIVKRLIECGGSIREMPHNDEPKRNEYLISKIGELEAINLLSQFNFLQNKKIII